MSVINVLLAITGNPMLTALVFLLFNGILLWIAAQELTPQKYSGNPILFDLSQGQLAFVTSETYKNAIIKASSSEPFELTLGKLPVSSEKFSEYVHTMVAYAQLEGKIEVRGNSVVQIQIEPNEPTEVVIKPSASQKAMGIRSGIIITIFVWGMYAFYLTIRQGLIP